MTRNMFSELNRRRRKIPHWDGSKTRKEYERIGHVYMLTFRSLYDLHLF